MFCERLNGKFEFKAKISFIEIVVFTGLMLITTTGCVEAAADAKESPGALKVGVKAFCVDIDEPVALIGRIMGDRASEFVVEVIPSENGKNVFEVESVNGKIVLRGDNGVSIASALNHYLKYFCHCDISWCGTQLTFPETLPSVDAKVRCVTPHKYRTFFNYCTFGYSIPWWTWKDWERAVDYLAMQGYNMPLAATGMEGVWYNTLLGFGFTDLQARSFISGPGHLPWQLMQCLDSTGGPLPKSWIDSHIELGRKIIQRQRALGMTPIQQGFTGHVPRLMKEKFPDAEIFYQSSWLHFPSLAQLDPLDPLFEKFGTVFIEEGIKLFGTSHLYAADPFHENRPPKPGKEYLSAVGKNIFSLMTKVDSEAIWVMQGWTNHYSIVAAVPKSRVIILAIGGGSNGDFWGYPFLNCRFNDFGNRTDLHGDLRTLAANSYAATVNAPNSNCIGIGMMMEGIFQNPVYLQMNNDLIWRNAPFDAAAWLHDYAHRRYGAESAAANKAWDLLLAGPYRPGGISTQYSSIIAARPALNPKKSGPNEGFHLRYQPKQLFDAWKLLLKDSDELKASDGYRFDVADITRQVLSNLGQTLQKEVTLAHLAKDKPAFKKASRQFLELLDDTDTITGTRPEIHFGKWVADARKWGTTEAESDLFERDASTLVTIWGPINDPLIFDYAWREWSGLIKNYYRVRWGMFFDHLAANPDYQDSSAPLDKFGRETLRANDFYNKLADWEIAWTQQRHNLPAEPTGDTIAISTKLLEKYRPWFEKVYSAGYQQKLQENMRLTSIPESAIKIGEWKSGDIRPAGKEIVIDVSKAVTNEADYEVTFTYMSGSHRLEIAWVSLSLNGTEIMRDTHLGWAGDPKKANTYKINPGTTAFNSKYEIRAWVYTAVGNDSNGVITLQKKTK